MSSYVSSNIMMVQIVTLLNQITNGEERLKLCLPVCVLELIRRSLEIVWLSQELLHALRRRLRLAALLLVPPSRLPEDAAVHVHALPGESALRRPAAAAREPRLQAPVPVRVFLARGGSERVEVRVSLPLCSVGGRLQV